MPWHGLWVTTQVPERPRKATRVRHVLYQFWPGGPGQRGVDRSRDVDAAPLVSEYVDRRYAVRQGSRLAPGALAPLSGETSVRRRMNTCPRHR